MLGYIDTKNMSVRVKVHGFKVSPEKGQSNMMLMFYPEKFYCAWICTQFIGGKTENLSLSKDCIALFLLTSDEIKLSDNISKETRLVTGVKLSSLHIRRLCSSY